MQNVEFSSGDRERVRGVLFAPDASGKFPGIVFTHGLLSEHAEFGTYPEQLAKRGFVTLAFDLRGHGTSDGQRGLISPARGVQDVRAAIDCLVAHPQVDAARLGLVGHSLGAALCVCATAEDARVRALVAIAPPASIRHELKPGEASVYAIVYRIGNIYRKLTGKSLYLPYRVGYDHIFHHNDARENARRQNLLQRTVPHENARVLVNDQDTLACARHVNIPTLVLIGEHDRVVTTARLVYEELRGPKHFVRLFDCGHSVMTDGHGDEYLEHLLDWFVRYLV